jgi:hypothetical protein
VATYAATFSLLAFLDVLASEALGPWDDPQGALDRCLREKDYFLRGRIPPTPSSGQVTVRHLLNRFLSSKQSRVRSNELGLQLFDALRSALQER